MKTILFLFFIATLSGCATGYQANSFSGGFSEIKYANDIVKIRFNGNAYTSSGTVADYCFLRAADYSYSNGYKYFVILDNKNNTTSETVQTSPGQVSYNSFNNTAYYTNPSYTTYNKASSSIMIKMTNENIHGSFNSEDVRMNLSKSLGVDLEKANRSISSENEDIKNATIYQKLFK